MRGLVIVGAGDAQYLERGREAKATIEQKTQLPLALQAIGGRCAKPFSPKGKRRVQVAGVKIGSGLGDHVVAEPTACHLLPDPTCAGTRAAGANHLIGKPCFRQQATLLQIVEQTRDDLDVVTVALKIALHLSA